MRIQCPSCAATYDVADALLDPPRVVRCAQCAHDWMPSATAEADAPPAQNAMPEAPSEHAADPSSTPSPDSLGVDSPQDATAEAMHGEDAALSSPGSPSALERLSAASEDKRIPATPPARSRLLTLAWAASFLILGLMGTAAYVKRDALMREWPASKRLYAMLGLWTPEKAVTQQASPPR